MLDEDVYTTNPQLRDYFLSLPGAVRVRLLSSGVFLESLGELMAAGENFRRTMT